MELEVDLAGGEAHEGDFDFVLADADDEDFAAELDGLDGACDGGLDACAFEGVRGLDVVCEGEDCGAEVVDGVAEFDLVGEGAGDQLAGEVEAALVNVGDDEGRCSCSLCAEEGDETDGAGTADEHGVAEPDIGAVEASKGDGERLEHGAVLEGHAVGHLVAPHSRVLQVATQQAGDWWCGKELDRLAAVVATCQAGLALVADDVWFDRDAVANLEVCDRFVNSHYNSRGLVTENVGIFNDHRTDASL